MGKDVRNRDQDLKKERDSIDSLEQILINKDSEIKNLTWEIELIRSEVGSFEQYLKSFEWEMKTHNDSLNRTLNKEDIKLPKGQEFNTQ